MPVRLAVGGDLQDRSPDRLQALPEACAAGSARQAQMAQVPDLLRPADDLDVLDGAGRGAGRGRTVQDHLPGRHHPPRLALWPVRG